MFADGRNAQAGDKDAASLPAESGRRAAAPAMRSRYGAVYASVCELGAGDSLRLDACDEMVAVLMPLSGAVAVHGASDVTHLSKGQILLLGQGASLGNARGDRASLLVIEIPRAAIQAEAYVQTGTPRRLGRADMLLDCRESGTGFARTIGAFAAGDVASDPADAAGTAIISQLTKDLLARGDRDQFFPIAGSVQRALNQLAQTGDEPVSLHDVIRAAGVVHTTLRRAMKEITGIPLSNFMQQARLDWFRARLRDDRESRSLRDLAAAMDYHPAVCSRAYQRRFGETPTQTRAQAFIGLR
jgi:AraC-like DNA-binding protein